MSGNPPIRHRNQAFVDPLHATFAAPSEAEAAAGLLGRPEIGLRRAWQALFAERGVRLEGHRLVEQAAQAQAGRTDVAPAGQTDAEAAG